MRWLERGSKSMGALFAGIRVRLFGMILLAVLPLVAVSGFELKQERQRNIEAAHANAVEIARHGADLYDRSILEARILLEAVAQISEISGATTQCNAALGRIRALRSWARALWVIGPDGSVVCANSPGGIGLNIADRPYFRRALTERTFVVSDFIIGRLQRVPTSLAILPVLDKDGAVVRLIAVSLRLSWFSRLAADVGKGTEALVLLFDGKGSLLARYPKKTEWIGTNWRGYPLSTKMETAEGSAEIVTLVSSPRIFGWGSVPGTQAKIAVGFDRAEVLAQVNGELARKGLALGIALLLAVLASIPLATCIAQPLKALTKGAEAGRHQIGASLPDVTGYAEVKSLASSLKALLAEREKREQALVVASASAEQAERHAREAHDRLSAAIEMLPEGIAIFDAEDRFALWNRRYLELYTGSGEGLVKGMRFEERLRQAIANGQYPEARGREEEWLAERLVRHLLPESSHEQPLSGDRWLRVEERRMADGGTIGIRVDITDLKRREASFRLLFEHNPLPMWVYDRETLRFLAVNDAAVAHYGYSRERFLSMTILDVRSSDQHDAVKSFVEQDVGEAASRIWQHFKADGTPITVAIYSRALTYAERSAKLVAIVDVTERRRAEARITHMAHHDAMTGLANRVLFRERLDEALARARAEDGSLAVHFIDLDFFKDVNDALGHPIGDALLRRAAERLRSCIRENDTVSRLGGDEFAIIQDGVKDPAHMGALATRIVEVIGEPFHLDGQDVVVSASVGIATAPHDAADPDSLLKYADMALYAAKTDGRRTFRFFEPDMDARLHARRALEIDLRAAFVREEFELYYQPTLDLASEAVIGFEALLRWNHPERGLVSPGEFIPLAETVGLIIPLGEWVLRQACTEAAGWAGDIAVSVNLSPAQFKNGDIVRTVIQALAASGLAARRLELEITETVLLQENENNLATLHQLRGLGVRIALDDFGTGYSSLSYLRTFPFDRIKIDGSFVKELPNNTECVSIVRAVIGLAKGLDMATTAEGVETLAQFEHLRADGCTNGQGYLFGRPRPAAEARALLAQHRAIAGYAA